MTDDFVLRWLDVAGTALFAASGALTAARARLDVIAAFFFAVLAALGGGTLRDVLIGARVGWLHDQLPLAVCIGTAALVWVVPPAWWPDRTLEWLDAAGLSAYAVSGASTALACAIAPLPAAALGVGTACLGSVARDIVASVPSIILRNELYVTAAVLASGLLVILEQFAVAPRWASIIAVAAGFALRGTAMELGLALPRHQGAAQKSRARGKDAKTVLGQDDI